MALHDIKNYQDVLDSICYIIDNSNLIMDPNLLVRISNFDIDARFEKEFSDLLKIEATWFEITYSAKYINNNINLNYELLQIRTEKNYNEVQEIINIVNKTSGLEAIDLEIVGDYIVSKEDVKKFHLLTKQLHVGPYMPFKEVKKSADADVTNKQYMRIVSKVGETSKNNRFHSFIESDYKDILLLVKDRAIDLNGIASLAPIYGQVNYINLINDLKRYFLITDLEFEELYSKRNTTKEYANSIDELIDFLKDARGLTIEGISKMKNHLTPFLYDELIFGLVKSGSFTIEEYYDYYNDIENELYK